MRILISPQELKGTLTAAQAAGALRSALLRALPDTELDVAPLADGGPGTVDALVPALGGGFRTSRVADPLGRPVDARWGLVDNGRTAVMEMAAASGIVLLAPEERDPRRASTSGTGELLRAALDAGCERIIVGLGGSATNDGGAGAITTLGARLLDAEGRALPPGGAALARLARLDVSGLDPRLRRVELIIANDVLNPLLGPEGASAVYGPQKGADATAVTELDAALARFAAAVRSELGVDLAGKPGTGAAGGLAYGLAAVAGGRIVSGFDMIRTALDLDRRVARADVVLTAEGRFDRQTRQGKGPWRLAALAKEAGRRAVLFTGSVAPDADRAHTPFDEIVTIGGEGLSHEELRRTAGPRLEAAAEAWARALPRR